MYLQPLVKTDLSGIGYLVGDTDAAICAVVDPPLDMIDDILEVAAAKGMRITAVIESQLHADPLSGSRELARRTGAPIYSHEWAAVDYPHQKLPDGIFRLFSTSGASTTNVFEQSEQPMASEVNAVMVRRYLEEVIHQGNVAAIDASMATNHSLNWPGSPTPMCGSEGFKHLLLLYASAFPDLSWTTEEVTGVSLDESDNDPARFWSYLLTALDASYRGIGQQALAHLRAPKAPPIQYVLTTLINAMTTRAAPCLLILDDYHVITEQAIHDGTTTLSGGDLLV